MTGRCEGGKEPLKEGSVDSFKVDFQLTCSATRYTRFFDALWDYNVNVSVSAGQTLGKAIGGIVTARYFRNLVSTKHKDACNLPDRANHSIRMRVEVRGRTAPSGFDPNYFVLRDEEDL